MELSKFRGLIIFFLLMAGSCVFAAAQTEPAPDNSAMAQAESLFQDQKWDEAAQAYTNIIKQNPASGIAWFRLGMLQQRAEKYDDALKSFNESLRLAQNNKRLPALTMYLIGSIYAIQHKNDEAFDWIGKALDAHMQLPAQIIKDTNLENLRGDPRFAQVVEKAKKAQMICMNMPEYRQFDFLIGDWKVTASGIQDIDADVSVKMQTDGCIIETVWIAGPTAGIDGYTSRSFNIYEPAMHKWHRSFGASGAVTAVLEGEYSDGAIRFNGTAFTAEGVQVLMRETFFNLGPDKARHLLETSGNNGKTWSTSYDATYARKK